MARVTVLNGADSDASGARNEPLGCVVCGINLSPCWIHVCQLHYPWLESQVVV
jgi:hypothetical protein